MFKKLPRRLVFSFCSAVTLSLTHAHASCQDSLLPYRGAIETMQSVRYLVWFDVPFTKLAFYLGRQGEGRMSCGIISGCGAIVGRNLRTLSGEYQRDVGRFDASYVVRGFENPVGNAQAADLQAGQQAFLRRFSELGSKEQKHLRSGRNGRWITDLKVTEDGQVTDAERDLLELGLKYGTEFGLVEFRDRNGQRLSLSLAPGVHATEISSSAIMEAFIRAARVALQRASVSDIQSLRVVHVHPGVSGNRFSRGDISVAHTLKAVLEVIGLNGVSVEAMVLFPTPDKTVGQKRFEIRSEAEWLRGDYQISVLALPAGVAVSQEWLQHRLTVH